MDGPNWGKLVQEGRAKALGVPWSDEELKALYEFKIPVEYIRAGCLTLPQFEAAKKSVESELSQGKKKPLRYMKKDELLKEASALGISFSEETTRPELIFLIEEKTKI